MGAAWLVDMEESLIHAVLLADESEVGKIIACLQIIERSIHLRSIIDTATASFIKSDGSSAVNPVDPVIYKPTLLLVPNLATAVWTEELRVHFSQFPVFY